MATFGSILDKPSKSIDKPKPLPRGTYVLLVRGLPTQGKSKTGTEYEEFCLEIVQPLQDVSDEAIEACGGVVGKTLPNFATRFYLTEDSVWRLKKFLVDDLELEEGDKSIREMLSEVAGKQVVGNLEHEPTNDGKGVNVRLASTGPVSALAEADDD